MAETRQVPNYARYPFPLLSPLRTEGRFANPVHRYEARLVFNALEPIADRGKFAQAEIAPPRAAGAAVHRDVRDGKGTRHKIVVRLEMSFDHVECAVAALHPVFQRMHLQVASAAHPREPEIGRADAWLQRVLVEEHPLQGFDTLHDTFSHQRHDDS